MAPGPGQNPVSAVELQGSPGALMHLPPWPYPVPGGGSLALALGLCRQCRIDRLAMQLSFFFLVILSRKLACLAYLHPITGKQIVED